MAVLLTSAYLKNLQAHIQFLIMELLNASDYASAKNN